MGMLAATPDARLIETPEHLQNARAHAHCPMSTLFDAVGIPVCIPVYLYSSVIL